MAPNVVEEFLLDSVSAHPHDLITFASARFGISRQAVHRHVQALVSKGLVTQTGETRAVTYSLGVLKSHLRAYSTTGLQESDVWHRDAAAVVADLPENVRAICQHGFTEMVNNAVDHSGSATVMVGMMRTARDVMITVADTGVGIFAKIRQQWGLDDERHAMLELSKGKLTTDPRNHSGEGIFFSSRMFDSFTIRSGLYAFAHFTGSDDWLFDNEPNPHSGTLVYMTLKIPTDRTTRQIFDAYADEHHDYGFTRTHLFIGLGRYEGEQLLARSQAKRLLARMERFREVRLDFKGVETIGQAFADEMFRVYPSFHPDIKFDVVNASHEVFLMIRRARALGANAQAQLHISGETPRVAPPTSEAPTTKRRAGKLSSKTTAEKKIAAKKRVTKKRVALKRATPRNRKAPKGRRDRGDE